MIEQPFAHDALDRRNHALAVRDLAMVPPKLELRAITVKMFLGKLMEDAVVSTLQESVETLGGVDVLAVDVDVNLRRVVDRGVSTVEHVADAKVRSEVIGDDFCSRIDVDDDVLAKRILRDVLDVLHSHVAVTLDKDGDRRFRCSTAALVVAGPWTRLAADVGFIGFYGSPQRRLVVGEPHGEPDAVCHVPSGPIGDAELSLDLQRRDAFLAARHQVNGHQPFRERDMAVLENGSDANRKLLSAVFTFALVDARTNRRFRFGLRCQRVDFLALAMRTHRAVRPNLPFDEGAGRSFIGEQVAQGRKVQKFVVRVAHCKSPLC